MCREQFRERCPRCQNGILAHRNPIGGEIKLVAIERFNHNDQKSESMIDFDDINVVCAILLLRKVLCCINILLQMICFHRFRITSYLSVQTSVSDPGNLTGPENRFRIQDISNLS